MSKEVILSFVKNINEHKPGSLAEIMSDDHNFIDAHGNIIEGKETMRDGWIGYFSWFPDYKIEITEIYEYGDTFVLFGYASGTFKGVNPDTNYWKLPAAWKAEIQDGKVKLWQVYCDTKIPYDIIELNKKKC
jgi:ketosteroid isomerase-like protein